MIFPIMEAKLLADNARGCRALSMWDKALYILDSVMLMFPRHARIPSQAIPSQTINCTGTQTDLSPLDMKPAAARSDLRMFE